MEEYEFQDNPHPAVRIIDYIRKIYENENCSKEEIKWFVQIKKQG